MNKAGKTQRRIAAERRTNATRPRVEALEDRCVPATFGVPWMDGNTTLSFAGDGTTISDQTSDLQSTLAAQYGPDWQLVILKAFQTWAVQTNLNVGVVSDGWQAFGTPGDSQGDDRFGDIRIGGTTLANDVLAITAPPDLMGSAWAGDVVVNTAQTFTFGGAGGAAGYDLFTAFLHEAGHSFGMGNSNASSSVMSDYRSPRTGLSAADIAGIQGLYGGARDKDAYEGSLGNDILSRAKQMETALVNGDPTNSVFAVDADIQNNGDVDFFKFKADLLGMASVTLRTEGTSLFVGTLSVYDKTGKLLASASADGPLDNDVTLSLSGLKWGEEYFVSVKSARSDVFGVGGYGLIVDTTPLTSPMTSEVIDSVLTDVRFLGDGLGSLLSLSSTTTLSPKTTTTDGSVRVYDKVGYLDLLHQTQTFKVASLNTSSPQNLVVTVRGLDPSILPRIKVMNASGQAVAATVLQNRDGTYSVTVAGVASNTNYLIQVSSAKPMVLQGAFHLSAVFTTKPVDAATNLDSSSLGGTGAASDTSTLSVSQTQVARFALTASAPSGSSSTSPVTMTIKDANGNVIFTLVAKPGETVTGDVRLPAGDYTVTYTVDPPTNGGAVPVKGYRLDYWTINDPIGPRSTNNSGGEYGGNTGNGSTSNSSTLAMKD